jgi:hypothetical protein
MELGFSLYTLCCHDLKNCLVGAVSSIASVGAPCERYNVSIKAIFYFGKKKIKKTKVVNKKEIIRTKQRHLLSLNIISCCKRSQAEMTS